MASEMKIETSDETGGRPKVTCCDRSNENLEHSKYINCR